MRGQGRKASLVKKLIVGSAILLVILAGTLSANLLAGDDQRAERMIKGTCAGCHKFTGEPESRFNLKAPDLMWAGSKYKRDWLIRWLTGKERGAGCGAGTAPAQFYLWLNDGRHLRRPALLDHQKWVDGNGHDGLFGAVR